MRNALLHLAVFTGLFAATACVASSEVGGDNPGGHPTTGGGATGGSSGTGSSSTGSGVTVGVKLGLVAVLEGASGATSLQGYTVTAGFRDAPDGTNGLYTTSEIGPCTIRVVVTEPINGTATYRNAGTVTVSGGSVPISLTPLTPDASSGTDYDAVPGFTSSLFSGGESFTFAATGAEVPAFTATVVAPSTIDLQSPVVPSDGVPFAFDRSADLVLTWTGGGHGDFHVSFLDPGDTSVECVFPSSLGSGTIPSAALAALTASSGGYFQIAVQSGGEQTVGDWTILTALSRTIDVQGAPTFTTTTYQALN